MLTAEKKNLFSSLYLLSKMASANNKQTFSVDLQKEDKDLEVVFEWMMARECVLIDEKQRYAISEKGWRIYDFFAERYQDFLRHFDVFSAVDLQEGSFAFERFFDLSEEDFKKHISEKRFDDLRSAVCSFKKIDPFEIVFMHFLKENRFGADCKEGWQFDLVLGSKWDEIIEIVKHSIFFEDLGYVDEETGEKISGESVIEDVMIQGAMLNKNLYERSKNEEGIFFGRENRTGLFFGKRKNQKIQSRQSIEQAFENYLDPHYVGAHWREKFL